MKTRHLKGPVVALACAALLGCSGVPVHMGLKKGERLPAGHSRDISSGACGFQVIFAYFPLGFAINGRLARAYAGLEREAAGDPITDVQMSEEWHYAFVGTSYCTKLRARAIHPTEELAPVPPPSPPAAMPAPAPGIFEKGAAATLKAGGTLRTRPRPVGDPVDIDAAATVQLGLHLRNEDGSWWYVSGDGKSGWVLEGDLEAAAPATLPPQQ